MTNYFTSPNIITPTDEVLDYDFQFKCNFKLKPYQKASVLKMLKHEDKFFIKTTIPNNYENILYDELSSKKNEYEFNDDKDFSIIEKNLLKYDEKNYIFNFHSNIGVLSNDVGSGKTSIVLGLIKYKPLMNKKYSYSKFMRDLVYDNLLLFPRDLTDLIADYHDPNISCQIITHLDKEYEKNNFIPISKPSQKKIETNLIIIPHNLFQQWKKEIQRLTNFNMKCLTTKKDFKFTEKYDNIEEYFNKYDVVLCNANKLKYLHNLTEDYFWSRIFIDEVDTINIPNFPYLQSNFLWFISTTYERILTPKNKGFINDLFRVENNWKENASKFYKMLLNSITYTCDKKYINKYLKLEKPIFNYIKYDSPFINKIIYNLNYPTIIKHLNSNNYKAIITYFWSGKYDFENTIWNYHHNEITNYNERRIMLVPNILKSEIINEKYMETTVILLCLMDLYKKIRYIKTIITNRISEYKEMKTIASSDNDNDHWLSINEAKRRIKRMSKYNINKVKKYYELINQVEYIKNQFGNNHICIYCHVQYNENVYDFQNTCCPICQYSEHSHLNYFKNNFYFYRELTRYKRNINMYCYELDIDFKKEPYCNSVIITSDVFSKRRKNKIFIDGYDKDLELNYNKLFKIKSRPQLKITKSNYKDNFNYNIKIDKLIDMLNKDKENGKRVLIFSDSIEFFNKIKTKFIQNDINFKILKGNNNVINSILRKYENKKVNVLLLNTKFCGSGLNLQMSDKIYITNYIDKETETQVVGRANRYGRVGKLQVNYIFYNEEIDTRKEDNEDEDIEDIDEEDEVEI